MAFSLTSKMEVTIINEVEVTKQSDAKELCFPKQTYVNFWTPIGPGNVPATK